MTAEGWLTAAVVVLILIGLIAEAAPPSVLVFSGVVVLLLAGVIDASQAFSGFSNPAPFTVGALFVVARAVSKTGAIRPLTRWVAGDSGDTRRPMLRTLLPTTLSSGFLNNIPLVAILIPELSAWARRRGSDVSKFLLPLSYAAILGGLLTLIGTSTNLVVAGQMEDFGLEPFSFFELGRVGLPIALLGLFTIVALSPRLIPSRRAPVSDLGEDSSEFTLAMEVVPDGPVAGSTVLAAKLRDLDGVFLVSIDRGDSTVAPAQPNTVLRGGDLLHFAGQVDRVLDIQGIPGLVLAEHRILEDLRAPQTKYFQVVIGGDSPLVGQTLKSAGFRSQYQAAVVAIHRSGHRIGEKLGDISIRIGDSFVVVADPGFGRRWRHQSDFLVIAGLDEDVTPPAPGGGLTLAVLAAMVLLTAFGVAPILHASLGAAILLIAVRVLTPDEARRGVDLEVVGLIAAAFGLATALGESGLADTIASGIVSGFESLGPRGVLIGVVLATIALTEFVTNNAAALLMFPIAIAAAGAASLDPRGMAVAVAIAASASFLTPIGYQTNTMVYGPGGYRISDYLKLGTPLTLIVIISVVWLVPEIYGA